jgi:hypothetical protein
MPEVPTPRQHPLPDQQPQQNLGAVSKSGAIAYMADQILRGAVQGYDAGRLQEAQQFNKKLTALSALDKQLKDQFTTAYYDVASSRTGPDGKLYTKQQILSDPSLGNDPDIANVRKLFNQGQVVHQATLSALESYLPHLKSDAKGKGKGKQGQPGQPGQPGPPGQQGNELQTYYNASKQLGWAGQYAVSDQQATAMYQQRQTAGSSGQAGLSTAQNQQRVAELENKYPRTPEEDAELASRKGTSTKPITRPDVQTIKLKNSQDVSAQWDGTKWTYLNGETIPADQLGSEAQVAGKPAKAWTYKNHVITDPNTGREWEDNDPNLPPDARLLADAAKRTMADKGLPTTTTHQGTFVDSNGMKQSYEYSTTTTKGVPAGGARESSPTTAPRTMATSNPKGLVEPGNIPIDNRPTIQNADGSHSSEYSVSFSQDGKEVLVPTVVNGKFLTPDGKKPKPGSPAERTMFDAAWKHYLDTGENLGKFDSPADADAYAQQLHNRGNKPAPLAARPPVSSTLKPSSTSTTHPIGYVGSVAYKDLRKSADKAQAVAADSVSQSKLALGYLNSVLKDPANGAAKMGLVATYLRNVVGAHPTAGGGASVRITNSEWNLAIQSRPWLAGALSHFSDKDGTVLSGVTLTTQQAHDLAYAVYQSATEVQTNAANLNTAAEEQRRKDEKAGGLTTSPSSSSSTPTTHSDLDKEILDLVKKK